MLYIVEKGDVLSANSFTLDIKLPGKTFMHIKNITGL